MDDFWGLAVKFVLTPEGSLAGSFPDFLGKLAYYLVCCSHGAFKPSFNLLPTKYTLITRMPSDFIIPISAPNKRRSFSFVALCFNDLILFMEKKKKENLWATALELEQGRQQTTVEWNVWFIRGELGKVIVSYSWFALSRVDPPISEWFYTKEIRVLNFSTSQSWNKLLPYGLGLERRETRNEGGFQLLASIHLELNSSETQLSEKRNKWSFTSSRVDLRSLLSVEEERSPVFLTTHLAGMSFLPLWGGLRKRHFAALVTQI